MVYARDTRSSPSRPRQSPPLPHRAPCGARGVRHSFDTNNTSHNNTTNNTTNSDNKNSNTDNNNANRMFELPEA